MLIFHCFKLISGCLCWSEAENWTLGGLTAVGLFRQVGMISEGGLSQLDGIIWALPSPAHLPHLFLPSLNHSCPCFGVVHLGGTANRGADGDKPPNLHRGDKSSILLQHHAFAVFPCQQKSCKRYDHFAWPGSDKNGKSSFPAVGPCFGKNIATSFSRSMVTATPLP